MDTIIIANGLRAHFPDRKHEVHHVDSNGAILEAWATDFTEGFEAKVTQLMDSTVEPSDQLIVFTNGIPTKVYG